MRSGSVYPRLNASARIAPCKRADVASRQRRNAQKSRNSGLPACLCNFFRYHPRRPFPIVSGEWKDREESRSCAASGSGYFRVFGRDRRVRQYPAHQSGRPRFWVLLARRSAFFARKGSILHRRPETEGKRRLPAIPGGAVRFGHVYSGIPGRVLKYASRWSQA